MSRIAALSVVAVGSLLVAACSWLPWAEHGGAAPPPPPRPARPLVAASAPVAPAPRVASGQDAYYAQRVAKDLGCTAPAMIDKGAGYEIYTATCKDGQAMNIRCEFGTCQAQR